LASIKIDNVITLINNTDGTNSCMAWNLTLEYNFESYTSINAHITGTNKYCTVLAKEESDVIFQGFERGTKGINMIVLILSFVSLILSIRHIYSVATIYMTTRYFYKKYQKDKDFKPYEKEVIERNYCCKSLERKTIDRSGNK